MITELDGPIDLSRNGHAPSQLSDYIPTEELLLTHQSKAEKHIVSFVEHGILRPGNITTIVGPSGFGKSSVTESIISAVLNPYCDSLGFRVLPLERPVLWIDGERTKDDIAIGFERIKRRIDIKENPELIAGERFKGIHCYPLILNHKRENRVRELKRLCEELSPSLLILDGAADFVRDVNGTLECVDFISLIVSLANKHSFGIITSIHPNPGVQNDHKPRGVLGSELIRTSESVLLLNRAPDDRDTRILTTHFAHGKNRNQNDNLEHYFRWDTPNSMFMTCNYVPKQKPKKIDEQQIAFETALGGEIQLSHGDLVQALKTMGKSESTAKRWIRYSALIEKNPINDKYYLR